ncbi:TetR/AcrR family transcriptional regulator [Streptomyces anulatus]|uniref:TetR/AcrR family transcriptional regulator n=1 Tax=Streptomyces anulatus TaxID=1892 RepID=UPI001D17E63C|nr:TetR/AcrR family transcriptional regulator [Streptomyces anulatus]
MGATRKQEISAETQRRLVAAAWELAAEGGAAAASVQAVADRSGISRGSVAWHFGSKDGLLKAVIVEAFRWGTSFMRERLAAAGPDAGVEALIGANFDLMSRPEAHVFSTLLIEAVSRESPLRATYAEEYAKIRGLYADHLRTADVHVADPEAVAAALLGGTLGINIQHRLDPDLDRRGAVTAMTDIYTDALSGT